jgi:hypothetical protein
MRTRSTAIGAEIAWLAEPEGGLRVRLELPLSTPRAAAG